MRYFLRSQVSQSLLVILLIASGTATAQQGSVSETIRDALPKVVKIYGAGGFKGLEAYGSGFLVSPEGHIVTSWGPLLDADPVAIVLDDGRRFGGKIVGVESGLGIAVLKIDPKGTSLPYFDLSEASDASSGERFLALSNMFRVAAGDEPVSVMHGMIVAKSPLSARRGRFEVSIESPVYFLDSVTNNPGAAGGVVVGLSGQLLGMIGREIRGEGSETWVNYAIPATDIGRKVLKILEGTLDEDSEIAGEPASSTKRSPTELGLILIPDVTLRTPAYISEVISGSSAEASGLKRDDLILFANDLPVRSVKEFSRLLSRMEGGDEVTLVVRRENRLVTTRLALP